MPSDDIEDGEMCDNLDEESGDIVYDEVNYNEHDYAEENEDEDEDEYEDDPIDNQCDMEDDNEGGDVGEAGKSTKTNDTSCVV